MIGVDYETSSSDAALSIIVVGASGDLARKKIFPALFALYCQGFLPKDVNILGFARSPMSDESFRESITEKLTCRYAPGSSCGKFMEAFLARCVYCAGAYGSSDAFLGLYERMRPLEGPGIANRMYYMAIPPFLFYDVARAIGDAGLVSCGEGPGWARAVIEKPFGSDRASSDELVSRMGQVFSENDTYRIDHYLGKEIIQNLLILRFANAVFAPLWNRNYIESVDISWKEDIGVGARGGYFDSYGVVRDVMQNHLLQILALTAMEPPAAFDSQHIRDEKVRLLRCIPPLSQGDIVLGQYDAAEFKGVSYPSYNMESGIPSDSITPTFASVLLHIENERWRGVPFRVTAGKGLDERLTEIRIRFRNVCDPTFAEVTRAMDANELVIRVQPDENIQLNIINKAPGLDMKLVNAPLDLKYAAKFDTLIPDAYECLLLDVIRGDKSLFIRWDELAAAWDIFTPALHELDSLKMKPLSYAFGSKGPAIR
jgi:glucose-6-phosphate 1-dehydrogenase